MCVEGIPGGGARPDEFFSTPNEAISDNATTTDEIEVTGLTGDVWGVVVTTNITHTYPGDLDITLTSPDESVVPLSLNRGDGNNDVFGTWGDAAAESVTTFVFTDGVAATELQPESPLEALRGDAANGTWTLSVTDELGGDQGTLVEWSLVLTTHPTLVLDPQTLDGAPVASSRAG